MMIEIWKLIQVFQGRHTTDDPTTRRVLIDLLIKSYAIFLSTNLN